ncbi:glycosyltransferase [Williamsia herbipolensis]|uniref:Glycosyltransferase n=1 Tax=Williamsia herbipolensis TaxID=1603258 RepID=A0AAU4K6T1_9NOCA|nr:glycosyltransferase [Williamsia herbipolensis]
MKVLFIGSDVYGSNSRSMRDGIIRSGDEVVTVDSAKISNLTGWSFARINRKLLGGRPSRSAVERVMSDVESAVESFRPDCVFAFKAINLPQARLHSLSVPLKVHYSADDVSNAQNVSTDYLEHESLWDAVITTKSHNVPELLARGVLNPLLVWSAYDPELHFRYRDVEHFDFLSGFIGNYRPDREKTIDSLCTLYGELFYLAGPGWRRARLGGLNFSPKVHPGVYGAMYSRAISRVSANLVLLNSDNRDQHTCRSFEVPAAGGLFVGPRTEEHEKILEDGSEAFLYSTEDELFEILERLRVDVEWARRVRIDGYRRVVEGRNTYADRWSEIRDSLIGQRSK